MGSTTLSLCQGWGILLRRYGDFTTGGDTFLGGEFSTGTMGKFQPELTRHREFVGLPRDMQVRSHVAALEDIFTWHKEDILYGSDAQVPAR